MGRRLSYSAAFGSGRPAGVVVLAISSALALGILGVSFPASVAAAGRQTVLPMQYPTVSGTKVACFEAKNHAYIGETEPMHCEVAGNVEFAGYLEGDATENTGDGSFARFPIKGEWERIVWEGDWGTFKSYGRSAINARNGTRVKLIVNRRVRCAGGGTWYSRATIFNLDNGYDIVLRLPVCGASI